MEVNLTKEQVLSLVEQRGISKADFAKMIGVDRRNLEIYLGSKKKDINLVIRIAEALNMDLYELLGLKEPKKEIYGCLIIDGVAHVVDSKEKILALIGEK